MDKFNRHPIAYVLASTNHGTMIINRNDYANRGKGNYGVGSNLFEHGSHDPGEVSLALQLLDMRHQHFGDGVIAVDCGANIGVHSIEWGCHMREWGSVIAFEAQERVFYALAGNIAINNCFNVRASWTAVGEKTGEIGVPIPDYFTPSSFGSLEIRKNENTEFIGQNIDYSAGNIQPTEMVALDDLNFHRLDFIKIDIEGMEIEALKGAKKTIEKCKPQLMIEKIKSDESALKAFLSALGYHIFPVSINLLAIHSDDPALTDIMSAFGMPK